VSELIGFLIRHSKWLVFTFYVVISCMLLFKDDPYRQHVYITSAGRLASTAYKGANNVTSYFNLHDINDDLNRRNAQLQAEIESLKEEIQELHEMGFNDTLVPDSGVPHFEFIVAHVISNTGPHSARVISLLNPHFRLSCKIKRSDYFGSLVWTGDNPMEASLEELPRHTVFKQGDTIVTSGYSAVFPAGLPVGVVLDEDTDKSSDFFTLRVGLFADFTRLGNVQIVINNRAEELSKLKEGEENDSKKNPFGQ